MNELSMLRTASLFLSRLKSIGAAATMFGGKRDFYTALGYATDVTYEQYRFRYERGDIASRIVDAYPEATWSNAEDGDQAEIYEDESPKVLTPFEQDCKALVDQLQLWPAFEAVDKLAGIGEYAIMLIGAPGASMADELPKGRPGGLLYLNAYAQGNARITKYDEDERSERFGLPVEYELVNLAPSGQTKSFGRKVHWTRAIHVADGVLDNPLLGAPRLKKVWNRLDDLEKVVGGGSEAFWKTVFQGMQIDIDKDMDLDPESKAELQAQVDEFEHGLRRVFRTRGVNVNSLGSAVSDFSSQASTLLDFISGTTKIPKRILLGSERGELASTQDRENWHDRVTARRTSYAFPKLVRPFIMRCVEYGYIRAPRQAGVFNVAWPKLGMRLAEAANIAVSLAGINDKMQETVVTGADIRDKVLGWDKLEPEDFDRGGLEEVDPRLQEPEPVASEPVVADDEQAAVA